MDDTKELMAPDGDEPCISLNAISGISLVATMRLAVLLLQDSAPAITVTMPASYLLCYPSLAEMRPPK
jgi:hypothetical protein